MFANPHLQRSPGRPAGGSLYQQVGVESRLSGASAHQLVAMLFDGYMEALAQGRGAMRARQLEAKGLAIGRAVRIVEEGLRAALNHRADGTLAQDLDELYSYLTLRLTLANLRNDEAALDECQRLMLPLQQAWSAIAPDAPAAGR